MITVNAINDVPFTPLMNATIRDKRLKLEHLGLLAWLLSHSKTYKVDRSSIQKQFKIGHNKLDKITRHLKECGYLEIVPIRAGNTGHITGWSWIAYGVARNHLTQNG